MAPIRLAARARLSLACMLMAGLASCAHSHVGSGTPLSVTELTMLATGNTLHIAAAQPGGALAASAPCGSTSRDCPPSRNSMIYLAPDGTGWIDRQTARGVPPWTGTLAMVVAWHVELPSTLCLTAAPLIGDMPSFSPPSHECIAVSRPPGATAPVLLAAVKQDQTAWTGRLTVMPGNVFPPALTRQWIDQVKALYGQQLPSWPDRG